MDKLDKKIILLRIVTNICIREKDYVMLDFFKATLEKRLNQREINKFQEVLNGTDKSDR